MPKEHRMFSTPQRRICRACGAKRVREWTHKKANNCIDCGQKKISNNGIRCIKCSIIERRKSYERSHVSLS